MSSSNSSGFTLSHEYFDAPKPLRGRHDPYIFHGSDSPSTSVTPPPTTPFTPLATPNASFSMAAPSPLLRPSSPPSVGVVGGITELATHRGQLADLARTAAGSSLMQSALQSGDVEGTYRLLHPELLPAANDLLLDGHGCYAMRALMDHMPPSEVAEMAQKIAVDEEMQFSLCTHSLHTRRIAQYLMDTVGAAFLEGVLTSRCDEVATTQQGCIVIQRAMDVARLDLRRRILSAVYSHAAQFAVDAFGNYVIQHAVDVDTADSASYHLWRAFGGRIVELSCNKFASNVIEKCLSKFVPAVQHKAIVEMYESSEETLLRMMHDSFGNYIIQSSIAVAPIPDVEYIASRLSNVVQQSPYGHKLVSRIERRLRGSGLSNCSQGSGRHGSGRPSGRRHPQPKRPIPVAPIVDHTVEESW